MVNVGGDRSGARQDRTAVTDPQLKQALAVRSMTGYATRRGSMGAHAWVWDLRGVNGKGLDLRLRVPDWVEGLEAGLRAGVGKAVARGSLSLSLRVTREGGDAGALCVDLPALRAVLAALSVIEAEAMDAGVTLRQASQADLLTIRGVTDQGRAEEDDPAPLRAALIADLPELLADFTAVRAAEGAALGAVIAGQLDRIAALTDAATLEADARREDSAARLRANLARILADGVDETRVAQELALLAVKADVTEELDRLRAHVEAARALLAEAGAIGRKLDFLTQEFMREANTLCAKAQALSLTRIGLDLKTVIDQMREQVQNVE